MLFIKYKNNFVITSNSKFFQTLISSAWLHIQNIQFSHGSITTIELSLKSCCNLVTIISTNTFTCLMWTIWHHCISINIVAKLKYRILFFNFTCQSAALNDAAFAFYFQYASCKMLINWCFQLCLIFTNLTVLARCLTGHTLRMLIIIHS